MNFLTSLYFIVRRLSGYEQDAFIRVPSPEKSEKRPTTTKSIRAVSAESGEMQQNGVIFVNNGMEIDPSTESGERMYMKMNSYSRGKDIPQITSVGGLSNLGLENFSDNDRFSVVVKYLMNYNQFKKVSI